MCSKMVVNVLKYFQYPEVFADTLPATLDSETSKLVGPNRNRNSNYQPSARHRNRNLNRQIYSNNSRSSDFMKSESEFRNRNPLNPNCQVRLGICARDFVVTGRVVADISKYV